MSSYYFVRKDAGFYSDKAVPRHDLGGYGSTEAKRHLDLGLSAVVDYLISRFVSCPWSSSAGLEASAPERKTVRRPLYTPEERARRDSSRWTLVQGILAPLQFLTFAISVALVVRYLTTGQGYAVATASILIKTGLLYAIMVTGSIWEKQVFGKWIFAPAFFWEDMVSMVVIGLQTAYVAALINNWGTPRDQMMIAMAAYGTYAINATQFLLKLRAARLEGAGGAGQRSLAA
jgi:3-vinyl bacteriochlorophyllide hydratase